MTSLNRRALLEATGVSLLGLSFTGTASAAPPVNEGVTLLEASLTVDVGNVADLDLTHSDRPLKYALDPTRGELHVRDVSTREARALERGVRLVNFRGISANADSIGGHTVTSLRQQEAETEAPGTSITAVDGYEMPAIEIDWEAGSSLGALASPHVREVRVEDGFLHVRLPRQSVDLRKKIVHDRLATDERLPAWKRSKVIERPTATVAVRPFLTVAIHRNLDVVDLDQ